MIKESPEDIISMHCIFDVRNTKCARLESAQCLLCKTSSWVCISPECISDLNITFHFAHCNQCDKGWMILDEKFKGNFIGNKWQPLKIS